MLCIINDFSLFASRLNDGLTQTHANRPTRMNIYTQICVKERNKSQGRNLKTSELLKRLLMKNTINNNHHILFRL